MYRVCKYWRQQWSSALVKKTAAKQRYSLLSTVSCIASMLRCTANFEFILHSIQLHCGLPTVGITKWAQLYNYFCCTRSIETLYWLIGDRTIYNYSNPSNQVTTPTHWAQNFQSRPSISPMQVPCFAATSTQVHGKASTLPACMKKGCAKKLQLYTVCYFSLW